MPNHRDRSFDHTGATSLLGRCRTRPIHVVRISGPSGIAHHNLYTGSGSYSYRWHSGRTSLTTPSARLGCGSPHGQCYCSGPNSPISTLVLSYSSRYLFYSSSHNRTTAWSGNWHHQSARDGGPRVSSPHQSVPGLGRHAIFLNGRTLTDQTATFSASHISKYYLMGRCIRLRRRAQCATRASGYWWRSSGSIRSKTHRISPYICSSFPGQSRSRLNYLSHPTSPFSAG